MDRISFGLQVGFHFLEKNPSLLKCGQLNLHRKCATPIRLSITKRSGSYKDIRFVFATLYSVSKRWENYGSSQHLIVHLTVGTDSDRS